MKTDFEFIQILADILYKVVAIFKSLGVSLPGPAKKQKGGRMKSAYLVGRLRRL